MNGIRLWVLKAAAETIHGENVSGSHVTDNVLQLFFQTVFRFDGRKNGEFGGA